MIGMHFRENEFSNIPAEVSHIRIWDAGVHWGAIHTAPDVYDWSRLDWIVNQCAGKHLTYVIAGCPRWLAKYPDNPHSAPWLGKGSNSMPYSLDEANKFAWNLATRYKGRIKAYEVLNEPQLADFLYPYTDAELNTAASMQKRFYSTIKSCDPNARVYAASVLPRESSGGMTRARKYLAALQRKDWNADTMTCHIYPEVGYWGPRWKNMLQDVTSTLKSMGCPTSKLAITETALGLLGPPITDAAAIDTFVKAVYEAAGGRWVYWYGWDRPDLGGAIINGGSPMWESIKAHNTK